MTTRPVPAGAAARLRQRLGLGPRDCVFGLFGYLRESKRVNSVLRAFADVRRAVPGCALLLAGDFVSSDLERAAGPLISQPGVVRLPYLEGAAFQAALASADCAVNLRYPAAGETSAITVRAMGAGIPVMVTAGQENERYPEAACLRVDPGPAERAALCDYMILAARFPTLRREMGRARGGVHRRPTCSGEGGPAVLEGAVRILLLAALACAAWAAGPGSTVQEIRVEVPMRDGVQLSANVFRPTAGGRFPAILYRTPYGKGSAISVNWQAFVDRGYAVVVQDVRGRYDSEGVFRPLEQEMQDGDDTLNWIARQPWSDGKVGMTGGSYLGIVQWKAALSGNPHLKAIFPWVSGSDDYRDRFYSPGGAFKLGQRLLWMAENLRESGYRPDFNRFIWHLPLGTADVAATGDVSEMYQAAMRHPRLRCLLAQDQHARKDRQNQGAGLFRGGLVRQFRGKRPGGNGGAA